MANSDWATVAAQGSSSSSPAWRPRLPKLTRTLLWVNLLLCVGFVVFFPPLPQEVLDSFEKERRANLSNSGISFSFVDTITGYIACRPVGAWSWMHDTASLGEKILLTADMPAVFVAMVVSVFWRSSKLSLPFGLGFCAESWLLAGVFVLASSIQWLLVGSILSAVPSWFQRHGTDERQNEVT